MQVSVKKYGSTWGVTPLEGAFAGRTVATVEAIAMSDVRKQGETIVGNVTSAWGTTLLADHLDVRTTRGVVGGRPFDYHKMKSASLRLFKSSRRAILSGSDFLTLEGGR